MLFARDLSLISIADAGRLASSTTSVKRMLAVLIQRVRQADSGPSPVRKQREHRTPAGGIP
jgi:hypothetical protein